jgi:hypothetical protein
MLQVLLIHMIDDIAPGLKTGHIDESGNLGLKKTAF